MKSTFRTFAWIAAVVLLVLAAGTLIPRPLWPSTESTDVATRRIFLFANPIHTDIAIPIDGLVLAQFYGLIESGIQADLPGARYLVFGWGGRDFYVNTPTWGDLTPAALLKGVTVDQSVMHVDLAGATSEPQPWLTGFDVSEDEFTRLIEFIAQSFVERDGRPVRIDGAGYGEFDGFFEAHGRFTALLGCNTWTAEALREAGLRTGLWNPLPQTLALSTRLYN